MAKKQKGSWVVRMSCTVTREVVCENCTEEEAASDPFGYAIEENDVELRDYEVLEVTPNI